MPTTGDEKCCRVAHKDHTGRGMNDEGSTTRQQLVGKFLTSFPISTELHAVYTPWHRYRCVGPYSFLYLAGFFWKWKPRSLTEVTDCCRLFRDAASEIAHPFPVMFSAFAANVSAIFVSQGISCWDVFFFQYWGHILPTTRAASAAESDFQSAAIVTARSERKTTRRRPFSSTQWNASFLGCHILLQTPGAPFIAKYWSKKHAHNILLLAFHTNGSEDSDKQVIHIPIRSNSFRLSLPSRPASFSPFRGGNGRKPIGWNYYPAVVAESAHRWLCRSVTKKRRDDCAEFENKGAGLRCWRGLNWGRDSPVCRWWNNLDLNGAAFQAKKEIISVTGPNGAPYLEQISSQLKVDHR